MHPERLNSWPTYRPLLLALALVQEFVEFFYIVQVGGRPSIGSKAGTKGEWKIGNLILPVPGDIRRAFLMIRICNPRSTKSSFVLHLDFRLSSRSY